MIINIDEFYNNKNWKQYVPLEAFQEEMRLVGETFLKDVEVKNVLSITYSIDDYGENPIYIEYLDEKDQKHLVKLKPAIHDELNSVLSKYATIDYVNQKFVEAVQTSKDYTDQAKEALTILINGSKEEAIKVSKAYTDVEINKLNTDLKEYIDAQDQSLMREIVTYSESAINEATYNSTSYTNQEINKSKQEVKDYADTQDNAKLIESKEYTDTKHNETLSAIRPLQSKLQNIWGGHKVSFIYWLPNIDVNTMKLENAENDVKVTLNDGDVVYWRKNEYQPVDLSGVEEGDAQTLADAKEYTNSRVNDAFSALVAGDKQTLGDAKAYTDSRVNDAFSALVAGDKQTLADAKAYTDAQLTNHVETGMLNLETVEAVAQEQNAINVENVSVSLQQKTRTMREVKNNSTLTNTKDFLILNLDFSFIPNVLPTSVETTFTENILIDAPEFNGKSFNVTFKANEHKASSKGVLGEPLSIKTPAFPTSETIKNIEVVVKDKIIIRKETE